jgi:hypothetical protein
MGWQAREHCAAAFRFPLSARQRLLPVEVVRRIRALGALQTLPRATTECIDRWSLVNYPLTWTQ